MSVYKAILKSLKACTTTIIVYFTVFAIFGNLSAKATTSSREKMFKDSKVTVAITDHDKSTLSQGLVKYLKDTQNVVSPKTKSIREMNDNVRFLIYDYALIIPDDFSEKALSGKTENLLEYVAPGQTAPQFLLSEKINTYIQNVMVYLKSGYSENEAIELANKNMTKLSKTTATVLDTADKNHRSYYTGMFTFNGYTLLMMVCISVCGVLSFTKEEDVRNRINVSGMPFKTRNTASILAVITIGFIITTAVNIAVAITGASDYNDKLLFYCLNSYVLMLVGLGLAFLISAITTNSNIVNMITNMLVLSMSFLCGVFIDLAFLSENIVKAAHFMPLYWYTAAVRYINDTAINKIFSTTFFEYLLLQLLFATIFFGAGLVISKKKEQYAI